MDPIKKVILASHRFESNVKGFARSTPQFGKWGGDLVAQHPEKADFPAKVWTPQSKGFAMTQGFPRERANKDDLASFPTYLVVWAIKFGTHWANIYPRETLPVTEVSDCAIGTGNPSIDPRCDSLRGFLPQQGPDLCKTFACTDVLWQPLTLPIVLVDGMEHFHSHNRIEDKHDHDEGHATQDGLPACNNKNNLADATNRTVAKFS